MIVRSQAASAMRGKSFLPRRYPRFITQSVSGVMMRVSVTRAKELLSNGVPVKYVGVRHCLPMRMY
jgi:hypothetical protein